MRQNGLPEHDHSGGGRGGNHMRPRRMKVPVYDKPGDVENPELGEIIYVNGENQIPRGRWRYTQTGWVSGSATTRFTISDSQRTVDSGGTFTLSEFTIPDTWQYETTVGVWNGYITTIQGPSTGLFVEVEDTTTGDVIYQNEAESSSIQVEEAGEPIATGGASGDTIRTRVRNTTNQSRTFISHVAMSIEQVIVP